MLLMPGLIAALIGAHLYLVAKLGTTAPPWIKADQKLSPELRKTARHSAMNQREKEEYLREYAS
jgi:quinol-cytochrome oxidoreductase complex cytochrome b subunit